MLSTHTEHISQVDGAIEGRAAPRDGDETTNKPQYFFNIWAFESQLEALRVIRAVNEVVNVR